MLPAVPWGWLGWAEVLARIYVFYYTCYFFHRSNKSALWETPSDSIRSTEIGFSHLCSPGHCCPKHWIRVPRCRLQWCTAYILKTALCAHLGISSATPPERISPSVSAEPYVAIHFNFTLLFAKGTMKEKKEREWRTLRQQMLLFASFLPQLSQVILACFSALIIPPSSTTPLLCRKTPYRVHVLWAGKGMGGFSSWQCHDPCL